MRFEFKCPTFAARGGGSGDSDGGDGIDFPRCSDCDQPPRLLQHQPHQLAPITNKLDGELLCAWRGACELADELDTDGKYLRLHSHSHLQRQQQRHFGSHGCSDCDQPPRLLQHQPHQLALITNNLDGELLCAWWGMRELADEFDTDGKYHLHSLSHLQQRHIGLNDLHERSDCDQPPCMLQHQLHQLALITYKLDGELLCSGGARGTDWRLESGASQLHCVSM